MSKKMMAAPVIVVLAVVLFFSGALLAQDIEKAKADYERLTNEIKEIYKKMEALQAGQEEEYKILNEQAEKLKAEIERLEKTLLGDQEMKQKIGEW